MTTPGSWRVLALAPYPETAPSTRFRVVQLQPALSALGVEVTLHPFLSGAAYRTLQRGGALRAVRVLAQAFASVRRVLEGAGAYDVVLVQRGIGLLLDQRFLGGLERRGIPLVYDFDDAVFLGQEGGRRWLEALRDPPGTTRAFCRAARVVLAGNGYLADFARRAVGRRHAHRVRVVPSVVDTDRFVPGARHEGVPRLGWVGSDTTVPYLEVLAPALAELARRVPHRLVVVAGARRPVLPGVDYDFVPWKPEDEAAHFQRLDVGLYPLDASPWSLGKCGFKAIQYLACGVPCVASPVGVLRDIVRPGETGLHATGTAEWVEACARLLAEPAERARMGSAGRALVEDAYSVRGVAPRVARAVEEALA
jgi:glycosyltransferase involved in cell wall biosynthesis